MCENTRALPLTFACETVEKRGVGARYIRVP